MDVVGYSDRLSVQPGDTIRFMVSCRMPTYTADIVRLIHGDTNPRGPGFKEELVETAVSGEYPGRTQQLYIGSYATVPDHPLLQQSSSFTLQCWIYPTTPQKGPQGILTKWSASDGTGYGLFVDHDGSLALWIGDQTGRVERLSTGKPLHAASWYFVAGVFDADGPRVSLYQEPVTAWPRDDSRAVTEQAVQTSTVSTNEVPFLMAGHWDKEPSGKAVVRGHFNGKIDSPRLFGRALNEKEVETLRQGAPPEDPVAAWDFARDFPSATVTDTSPNALHGTTVNMPARAMTGHNWTGNETNFNLAPGEYGAIHFHDDDLEDARWEVDFELKVPQGMRSGVYAARLRAGDGDAEDYLPFFLRPKRGTSTAPILYLAATATYQAYANTQMVDIFPGEMEMAKELGKEINYPVLPQDKYILENKLLSAYDLHSDGSGVCYSSRLRPMMSMRPKYTWELLGMGEGDPKEFNADLHLVDWLEAKGYRFDVVTDEDLHLEGADLLAPYNVVITGSHPEYWSAQMLDSLETYLANGGRHMYLGGNGYYWVTTFDSQRPHVIELRRWHGSESWEAEPGEYYHNTTGEFGGLWRFRGKAPQSVVGVGLTAYGWDFSAPYRRQPGSFDPRASFIFEGIANDEVIGDFGLVMGGAGGFEIDRADAALGTPPHTLVLATATGFSDIYLHVVEEILTNDSFQGGTVNPLVKADMVYFETPDGGAVFSVGSIAWCGSLSHNHYDNNVSRITENVLKRFASRDPL